MKRPFPIHAVVLLVTVLGGGWLLACTQSKAEDTPADPTPAGPRVTQTNDDNVGSPQSGSKCEQLGILNATSLPGLLIREATPSQFTVFNLPNRPVEARVKVLAVGQPSTLIGQAAVLGAGPNLTWSTCTHCVLIAIGCASADDCSTAAFFFPRRGTATFSAVASGFGQPFTGTLDDVELEQVTIDPKTLVSTPVLNGACMHVSKLTYSSSITSADGDEGGSSGTSSGTSGSTDVDAGDDGGGGGKSSTSSGGRSSIQ